MKEYVIKNLKEYVLSFLRGSSYRSGVSEYFENALYYAEHGQEDMARTQLICAARYLEQGGSDEQTMARHIRNSI